MTLRLYIDEDAMDRDPVRALRARGVDVMTAEQLRLKQSMEIGRESDQNER